MACRALLDHRAGRPPIPAAGRWRAPAPGVATPGRHRARSAGSIQSAVETRAYAPIVADGSGAFQKNIQQAHRESPPGYRRRQGQRSSASAPRSMRRDDPSSMRSSDPRPPAPDRAVRREIEAYQDNSSMCMVVTSTTDVMPHQAGRRSPRHPQRCVPAIISSMTRPRMCGQSPGVSSTTGRRRFDLRDARIGGGLSARR